MNKIKTIKTIIFSALIFIIYYNFSYIVDFILELLNITINNRASVIILLYVCDILPVLLLLFIYRKDLKKEFIKFKENFIPTFEDNFKLWLLGLILMSATNLLIAFFTTSTNSSNEEAIESIRSVLPVYIIISSCIIAPIGEELAFRKCLYNLSNKDKLLSLFTTFILFGLAHVLGTYESIEDFLYIISYGLFGSVFMYMYIKSESIFTTISFHFMHNTILTILMFLR